MPVRRYVLAIVLFWMATTGWLVYREWWAHHGGGEPPPVSIDLPDEWGQLTRWTVRLGNSNRKIGWTESNVRYNREDDTYNLHTHFQQFTPAGGEPWPFPIKSMRGDYRITRLGELRGIEEEITLDFPVLGEVKVNVKGTVERNILTPKLEILVGGRYEVECPPVEVSKHGSVLNPLQIVNAIRGVREGQRWRMPVFDPLGESVRAKLKLGEPGVRYASAEVHRAPEPIVWLGREEPCLVIDYHSEETSARTWVRERDGLVLRQEATLKGFGEDHHLVQDRNPN